ncbi:DUF485 domain-containing protein [Candidatus Riflebacteria bacterium]
MDHGPAVKLSVDHAIETKTNIGFVCFIFYCVVYSGFVIINTLNPRLMNMQVAFGLNLAVFYGFGLIILAIVMGLIYHFVCSSIEDKMNNEAEADEKEVVE